LAVFFTHIPKTGGTSIQESLVEANLSKEEIYTPKGYRDLIRHQDAFRCLAGHHPYGIHQLSSTPTDPVYFTMLRDPIERVISFYYECLWPRPFEKVSQHPEHARAWRLDLVDFCRLHRFRNVQTKMLAGVVSNYIGKFISVDVPGIRGVVLSAAKRNLKESYVAFGLTEHFEESRSWISRELGWDISPIERRRAAYPDRPTSADLSDETVRRLRKLNALDVEFYRFASDLFERRTQASARSEA